MAYQITALVIAAPEFNPERTDAGVFDVPPFVGPCVEFGMKLEVDSVSTVELAPEPPSQAEPKAATNPDNPRPER